MGLLALRFDIHSIKRSCSDHPHPTPGKLTMTIWVKNNKLLISYELGQFSDSLQYPWSSHGLALTKMQTWYVELARLDENNHLSILLQYYFDTSGLHFDACTMIFWATQCFVDIDVFTYQ